MCVWGGEYECESMCSCMCVRCVCACVVGTTEGQAPVGIRDVRSAGMQEQKARQREKLQVGSGGGAG